MSEHRASLRWSRRSIGDSYSRDHVWTVAGALDIPASASPAVVPPPLATEGRLDPEAAFVGSVSSCHMLWFLSIAERKGYIVTRYTDDAVGALEKDAQGRLSITRVHLNPLVAFGKKAPTAQELDAMHDMAHAQCFIAHSIKTAIEVTATMEFDDV